MREARTLPDDLAARLSEHGITPTAQRVEIAKLLFSRCEHLSADEIFALVNADGARVSKATVYNTLGVLAEKGLIREVIVDPNKVFFDPNTSPHHHFYNVETGELTDIDADEIKVGGLPTVPAGTAIDGVDVVVRLRPAR